MNATNKTPWANSFFWMEALCSPHFLTEGIMYVCIKIFICV